MPRKNKTTTGAPAQAPPKSVPGVRYGDGVAHQQMAKAMPPVDAQAQTAAAMTGMSGGAAPAPAGPPMDIQQAMASLADAPIGGLMASDNPKEPVTTGLSTGPGAGPEAIQRGRSPLARTMENMYRATGDPTFYNLAKKAGL